MFYPRPFPSCPRPGRGRSSRHSGRGDMPPWEDADVGHRRFESVQRHSSSRGSTVCPGRGLTPEEMPVEPSLLYLALCGRTRNGGAAVQC